MFIIKFSDDLIWLTLGLGVVMRLSYLNLVNPSNNQVPQPITSLLPVIFTDNDKFLDDPVVRVSGAAYLCLSFEWKIN